MSLLGVANGDHNAQSIINSGSLSYRAVLDASNAQVIGPDYDEIKDELYTKKSSEKPLHHFEDKSVEFTKSSNEYFTLMPQEEQAEAVINVNMLCLSLVACYTPQYCGVASYSILYIQSLNITCLHL